MDEQKIYTRVEDLLVDIPRLNDIIAKVPQSVTQELAEICFEYFSKYSKLEPFLTWTMKREILITSK